MRYPTVVLSILFVLAVVVVLCIINPLSNEQDTKSVIAFEDIIFKSTQDEKLWDDVSGKEIKYYSDYVAHHDMLGLGLMKQMETKEDRKSMLLLTWNLFKLYLRNDHTVLSIFQRTAGTNWSLRQRLGCFFVYIVTIMVATGMYYGTDSTNVWSDIIASFIISLVSTTPSFIIRKLFEYSKPRQERVHEHPELNAEQSVADGVVGTVTNLEVIQEMRV